MNREKEDQLPLMQVGFIDSICLPIYQVTIILFTITLELKFVCKFSLKIDWSSFKKSVNLKSLYNTISHLKFFIPFIFTVQILQKYVIIDWTFSRKNKYENSKILLTLVILL